MSPYDPAEHLSLRDKVRDRLTGTLRDTLVRDALVERPSLVLCVSFDTYLGCWVASPIGGPFSDTSYAVRDLDPVRAVSLCLAQEVR